MRIRFFHPLSSRAQEFTEALVEYARSLRLGHGLDAGIDLGPMRPSQRLLCAQ
jgi:acyl-CoA reductase-like NAD-dependent aldehyde dehydrogenase